MGGNPGKNKETGTGKEQLNTTEDPFKDAFGSSPMEIEAIPGAPPPPPPPQEIVMEDATDEAHQHTPQPTPHTQAQTEANDTNVATAANAPEDCLSKVADWLMDSLQMKFTGRDDDFWDDTYRAPIPLLESSGSLKTALANGLPEGADWQSICHKLLAIVINRFQPGDPQAASPAPSAMSSAVASSVSGNNEISGTGKGNSQAGREKGDEASVDSQQWRGAEGDADGGDRDRANKGRDHTINQTEPKPEGMRGSGETPVGEGKEDDGGDGTGANKGQHAKEGRTEDREHDEHDSGRLEDRETQVGKGQQPDETERTINLAQGQEEEGLCLALAAWSPDATTTCHRTGKDIYIQYGHEEVDLRWFNEEALSDLQLLKIKPGDLWTAEETTTLLAKLVLNGTLRNGGTLSTALWLPL
ncbi:hypothetical protein CBR_g49641 [Chara braunii]|uniref:Uncharacterized protein n=1 Tax=Chara braunii TaxID=69332 RepID=A0A388M5H3_CHABU|nr:hypothetical protein CBR_g49641 [Chara braunii]|eukprot:GBG89790.1 hypothetical protein CBR_g49641 [Chara braunii]